MKFRRFITAATKRLDEADLLGTPSSTSPKPTPKPTESLTPSRPDPGDGSTTKPVPRPNEMHDEKGRAISLTHELGKAQQALPHPMASHFRQELRSLAVLAKKLQSAL